MELEFNNGRGWTLAAVVSHLWMIALLMLISWPHYKVVAMKWRIGEAQRAHAPFSKPFLSYLRYTPTISALSLSYLCSSYRFNTNFLLARRRFFVPRITPPFHYYLLLQNPGSFFDNCGGCMIDYIDIITLSQLHKNSGGGCDGLRVPCQALRIGLVIGTARKVVAQTIWLIRCGNRTHQWLNNENETWASMHTHQRGMAITNWTDDNKTITEQR